MKENNILIEIDESSGFCFGVVNAIRKAEDALKSGEELYCLGDIVHNNMEVQRLEKLGMKTIERDEFERLKGKTVLFRAHGEPPSTYTKAKGNDTRLVDATCPVVLRLQRNVRAAYEKSLNDNGQVVIYGKRGHAEVNGLVGQTEGNAIVLESKEDIAKIDLNRPVRLFSQTTMMVDKYEEIQSLIHQEIAHEDLLESHNTLCRQVSGRIEALQKFSTRNDVIIFVSGEKSSNGKSLFRECQKVNVNSHMVADHQGLNEDWFAGVQRIGVCGATSTPVWLMREVADHIKTLV